MKINHNTFSVISILFFLLSSLFTGSAAGTESYNVDPVHTSIVFRIKHLNVAYFFGRFNGASGTIVVDREVVSNSSVDIQVKVNDVDTFNSDRDKHLKTADFFDAQKYPVIEFKSRSVKKIDPTTLEVSGDIMFHGAKRPLTVRVLQTGSGKDPWGNFRMGFETDFTIKRSEFGMDKMLNLIGDEVRITVSVEGVRK